MRVCAGLLAAMLMALLTSLTAGCASMRAENKQQHHVSSLLSYLSPAADAGQAVAEIRVPVRLGIAFVPDGDSPNNLPEGDRVRLIEKVRESFGHYPFIAQIQTIPSEYLEMGGGFANIDKIGALL